LQEKFGVPQKKTWIPNLHSTKTTSKTGWLQLRKVQRKTSFSLNGAVFLRVSKTTYATYTWGDSMELPVGEGSFFVTLRKDIEQVYL